MFDPDRERTAEPLVSVRCRRHEGALRDGWETDPLLPKPASPRYRASLCWNGEVWCRHLSVEEAVVASGAMSCQSCSAQALYLTSGVDHGVPDKWWPAVVCREHAQAHAEFNGGTVEAPGDNFSVSLTWNGSGWGRALPWPLADVAPDDVLTSVAEVSEAATDWELEQAALAPWLRRWREMAGVSVTAREALVDADGWRPDAATVCAKDLPIGALCWCGACRQGHSSRGDTAVHYSFSIVDELRGDLSTAWGEQTMDGLLAALARQLDLDATTEQAQLIWGLVRAGADWREAAFIGRSLGRAPGADEVEWPPGL